MFDVILMFPVHFQDHERKRKMELKCLELEELLREQGYEEKEVKEKVRFRRGGGQGLKGGTNILSFPG